MWRGRSIGALGGVALGSIATWATQAYVLRHQDSTRFDRDKRELYADFSRCANLAMAAARAETRDKESIARSLVVFEQLRFLAPRSMLHKVAAVHELVGQAVDRDVPDETEELVPGFNEAMEAMYTEGRADLRVVE